MDYLRKWLKLLVGINLIYLQSCALSPSQSPRPPLLEFHTAITTLSHHLLTQVEHYEGLEPSLTPPVTIVIDPFVDANGGEVIRASRAIEEIIRAEGKKNFSQFTLLRLTPEALDMARYLIDGILLYEGLMSNTTPEEKRYYHIFASVIEIKTGKVVASSNVWLADAKLDDEAIVGSPMINIDAYLQNLVVTAKLPPGMQVDLNYLNSLNTNA